MGKESKPAKAIWSRAVCERRGCRWKGPWRGPGETRELNQDHLNHQNETTVYSQQAGESWHLTTTKDKRAKRKPIF